MLEEEEARKRECEGIFLACKVYLFTNFKNIIIKTNKQTNLKIYKCETIC